MDANELAEAIARAVVAAKPAPEHCWGLAEWSACMSSSEWAAWVQAVFSIVAIVAAFGVAWGSHCLQRRAELGRMLQVADQVALRVWRRLDGYMRARDTTAGPYDLFFDSEHALAAREFMKAHLKREIATEQDVLSLIVSKRSVSHHLSQALALIEQNIADIELLADIDVPIHQRASIIQNYKDRTAAAFVSFEAAQVAIRDYLDARGFRVVPLTSLP